MVEEIGAARMFVGAVVEGRWAYAGHQVAPPLDLEVLLARLQAGHTAAMTALRTLSDNELGAERRGLQGMPVKVWRLLMAMVEHEVHHRSQIAVYVSLLGVPPPQIYGLGVEDVIALATG